MRRLILGIALVFSTLATAQSVPAGVVLVSEPQTISVGAISETLTIQAQDGSGNAFKLPSTGCLALSSSASGEFSSSASSWSAISVLTMNKNSANRNFFYKGTAAGTHTLTARLVLKPESETRSCANWPLAEWSTGWTTTQQITINPGADIAEAPVASMSSPESHSGPVNVGTDPVPSLVVKISGPAVTTAGADATFSAQVFGVKKELIPNARVLWSFGNGATREGASVQFAYNIPGSYLVSVDAASGGLAGMARLVVQALEPNIRVSRVAPGPEGFVEIENGSGVELEVSGWGIASGATHFTLPERTFVLPRARVAFPASITGVFVVGNDARLLFPNGKVAAEYVAPPPVVLFQNPPPAPSFIKEGETGGGGFNTSTPAAISLSLSDEKQVDGLGKWLWGVLGVSVLGVGALAAFRFKPVAPQVENEEKTFAKEVRIV